jgi:hypothetical protein
VWKKWFGRNDRQAENLYDGIDPARVPRHVAIIMDGNGRWALKRGLPRTFGPGRRGGAQGDRALGGRAAHRRADDVRFLHRELETAGGGSRFADENLFRLSR